MSLDHILLGMLRAPATGYELGRAFEETARHFWYAERSQIYPALKKLRTRGYLESWEAPSERGPKRQMYRTTEEGRRVLRQWLAEGPHLGHDRLAYVAQIFFGDELDDPTAMMRTLEALRSTWEQRLAQLEHTEHSLGLDDSDATELDEETFFSYATMRLGIHQLRSKLAWCRETIDRLRTRSEPLAATTEER